ncbi:MAG: MerR family transcriptional regulator [Thermodesulfobacteriota bacterium]
MVRKEDEDFEEYPIGIDEPIYTTGVVSRLLGIPVHVLKQLDEEDIVRPPRKKGRARLYSKREIKKVEHCWHYMKERKVNVDGLRVILEMEEKEKQG